MTHCTPATTLSTRIKSQADRRGWLETIRLGLLLLAFSATGCIDRTQNPDIGGVDQEVFPLAVGNYWDYYIWNVLPELGDTFRDKIVNEYSLNFDGREYRAFGYNSLPLNSEVEIIPNGMEWLWAHSPRGLLLFGGKYQDQTYLNNELYLKYPGTAGDTWVMQTVLFNTQTGRFSRAKSLPILLLETGAPCRTETLAIDGCHVYQYEEFGEGDQIYHWFTYVYVKPGIGIVTIETLTDPRDQQSPAPRVVARKQLLDFHIAQ